MDELDVPASVIVPTYGRPVYLRDALVSLLKQDFPPEWYEIIVVDNRPAGEVRQIVQELEQKWQRPIHYVDEPNVGLHNARHAGAQAAQGEILVYVDDDVIAPPDWLKAMLKPYADSQVACVGGKTLPRWEAEPPVWLNQFGGNGGGNLSLLDLGDDSLELAWPETVYGCNMSVRRSVLYEVGGFNPDAIGERRLIWLRGDGETGLQEKIYDAGHKVLYEPRAGLYHRIPASRLRPEYFYWRAFIQGISDSYSRVRKMGTDRLLPVRLLWHGLMCLRRVARCYLSSIRYSDKRIRLRASTWYWYGRGLHQIRVAFNRRLLRHVLQEAYL